jgi:hypothetical protein
LTLASPNVFHWVTQSFPHLEAMKRSKSASAAPPASATPLSLLGALARAENKAMPVTELMSSTESRFVTLSGPPSAEVVTLTTQGEEVARRGGEVTFRI